MNTVKLKTINLDKNDLLFVYCPNATEADMNEIKQFLPRKAKCVIINFEVGVRKVNISGVSILKVKAEGHTFDLEDVRCLGDIIEDQIKHKEQRKIKKNKFKFIAKDHKQT